jgi:hypothetical protein
MLLVGQKEFGGGFVRVSFTVNEERLKVGTPLSADAIRSFGNYPRLIETGHIAVYPPSPSGVGGERHVLHKGRGEFDVIEGRKLNDAPLSKDEAYALAGHPLS